MEEASRLVKKVMFVGDHGVGKTSLINRYIRGEFVEATAPTIGIDFKTKSLTIDSTNITLQIWDTGGGK
jgi:small GTP-binding protein